MKIFYKNLSIQKMKHKNKDKITDLKEKINALINQLYDEINNKALSLDQLRLPVYGISQPQFENPVNLF